MISDKELICACIFLILMCFIIDIKLGMICSTIVFAVFLVFFIRKNEGFMVLENYNDNLVCYDRPQTATLPNDISTDVNYARKKAPCMSENCYKLNTDPFRTKAVIVNKDMKSDNHALEGGANPKTRIPRTFKRFSGLMGKLICHFDYLLAHNFLHQFNYFIV